MVRRQRPRQEDVLERCGGAGQKAPERDGDARVAARAGQVRQLARQPIVDRLLPDNSESRPGEISARSLRAVTWGGLPKPHGVAEFSLRRLRGQAGRARAPVGARPLLAVRPGWRPPEAARGGTVLSGETARNPKERGVDTQREKFSKKEKARERERRRKEPGPQPTPLGHAET